MKSLILGVMALVSVLQVSAQRDSLYAIRLVLASIDTSQQEVCYDLQIRNVGQDTIIPSAYNTLIFFDASVATFKSDSTLLPLGIYGHDVRQNGTTSPGDIRNSGLTYEDSITMLRASMEFKQSGIGDTLPPGGDWYSTARLCFEINHQDMTYPNLCLGINFLTPEISTAFGGTVTDIFRVWRDDRTDREVLRDTAYSIIPMANRTSCFVINEAEHGLCADGTDNDEDGDADCDDCDCSPGSVIASFIDPTCTNREGMITFSGGKSGVMYSIDAGITFTADSVFMVQDTGAYTLMARMNDVEACQFSQTITLSLPDCREADAITCSDGMDNDADGLIDNDDDGCCPAFVMVFSSDPDDCPSLDNGEIEIMTPSSQVQYSIDSGLTYQSAAVFGGLMQDTLYVMVRDTVTQCIVSYDQNPVILTNALICPEDCRDNVDNDLDGLIDCLDPDCATTTVCFVAPQVLVANIISLGSPINNLMHITADRSITLQVDIYDRWGSLIHHNPSYETNTKTGWDGTDDKANTVATGVYIYHINYTLDGNRYDQWGDVTVID